MSKTNVVPLRRPATSLQIACSACGATTEAACDCGLPYVPAKERAAAAVAVNPEKSDRSIAAEIGVDHKTVGAARRSVGEHSPPEKRTGQDGKSYPATRPAKKPVYSKKEEAERERGAFLLRAQEARRFAFHKCKPDKQLVEHARKTAAAWSELANQMQKAVEPPRSSKAVALPHYAMEPDKVSGGNGLTVTLKEEWREPMARTEEYLGVPVAEYVNFLLVLGEAAFNRKFQNGLTSQIEWWLVEMHSKYPDTFNVGSWEGSCGHLSIDELRAKHGTPETA